MISGSNTKNLYEQAGSLSIKEFGHTLVVAPHPDDESLGCGGTIALLRQAGIPMNVIFVSDGSMSHPNSKKYGEEERIKLREQEALNALQILGVAASDVFFMRLKDGDVPGDNDAGFKLHAVLRFVQLMQMTKPATLIIPWRRDPHKDHRATYQIVQAALKHYLNPVRVLEYFIWLWERSSAEDLPSPDEAFLCQVDISSVAAHKQQAIMAHTSQVTRLIDDDPDGFILSPEVLAHFSGRYELFAESRIN